MQPSEISKIKNPFKFGSIIDGDNFCNRVEELRIIKQYVFDNYSFWLYSPRRFGKSSLIKRAFEEIEGTKTIFIDLYNVKSLYDFAKKYSEILSENLFDWKHELKAISKNLSKYFTNLHPIVTLNAEGFPSMTIEKKQIDSQIDIEQLLNMPESFAKDKGIKICIAFDEFQEIERIDPFIINWMRTAFQNHKNVSYIFLGSKQSLMHSIFASTNSPFYEFAVKMDLSEISEKDLRKFIKEKFKKSNISINNDTITEILEKSELHPHFTQYFASVVFDLLRYGEDENEKYFNQGWMNKIINSQSIIFQTIYDQLSSNQRRVLTAIAIIDNDVELFADSTRREYDLPISSSISVTLGALIKKSLIYKTTDNKYKVDNPVLKEWLRQLNYGLLS